MQAPIKQPCASKRGCGVTSVGARIVSVDGRARGRFECRSVGETVKELDGRGAWALVLRHAGHGRINLVYRRADGHIGWIDSPTIETNDH
jgi:alpha-beta hydrolase superfamily lysophospholipase